MSRTLGKLAPKLLCSHLVTISSGNGSEPEQDGLLEEISTRGAVATLGSPIRSGAAIRIDCQRCELRGKVIGCRKLATGYSVEVEFPAEETWVPAVFRPDGLFNPQSMICARPGCESDCVNASCTRDGWFQ